MVRAAVAGARAHLAPVLDPPLYTGDGLQRTQRSCHLRDLSPPST
jgi:hypothetical protein